MPPIFTLLAPCLFPSWRFFQEVGPSPRIEVRFSSGSGSWQDPRPKPDRLRLWEVVLSLFHNPTGNENLFWMSLAERLVAEPTAEIEALLTARIAHGLNRTDFEFRVLLVSKEGSQLRRQVAFQSAPPPP